MATFKIANINNLVDDIEPVKLYPNPFSNELTIEIDMAKPSSLRMLLFDLKGQMIKSIYNSENNSGKQKISIHENELTSGIYLIKIITDYSVVIDKIAKQ